METNSITLNFINLPQDLHVYILSFLNEDLTDTIPCVSKYFKELSIHHNLWRMVGNRLRIDADKIDLRDPKKSCIEAIKQSNDLAIQLFFPNHSIAEVHPLTKRKIILENLINLFLENSFNNKLSKKVNKAIESDQIEVIKFLIETQIPILGIHHVAVATINRKITILKLMMDKLGPSLEYFYEQCKRDNAIIEGHRSKFNEEYNSQEDKEFFDVQFSDDDFIAQIFLQDTTITTHEYAKKMLNHPTNADLKKKISYLKKRVLKLEKQGKYIKAEDYEQSKKKIINIEHDCHLLEDNIDITDSINSEFEYITLISNELTISIFNDAKKMLADTL